VLVLIASVFFAAQTNNYAAQLPEDVTYCQLAEAPSHFVGKTIRVRAIYSYMFEVSVLRPPECCQQQKHDSIWVEFDDELSRDSKHLQHSFPRGMGFVLATFTGKFEGSGPYGAGALRFQLTVFRIEKLEHKVNPRPDHHPAWIPQNCRALRPPSARTLRF
jgi:hypothetical protein